MLLLDMYPFFTNLFTFFSILLKVISKFSKSICSLEYGILTNGFGVCRFEVDIPGKLTFCIKKLTCGAFLI